MGRLPSLSCCFVFADRVPLGRQLPAEPCTVQDRTPGEGAQAAHFMASCLGGATPPPPHCPAGHTRSERPQSPALPPPVVRYTDRYIPRSLLHTLSKLL